MVTQILSYLYINVSRYATDDEETSVLACSYALLTNRYENKHMFWRQ